MYGGRCFPPVKLVSVVSRLSVKPASASSAGEGREPCGRKGGRLPGEIKRYDLKPEAPALPSGSPPGMGQRRTPRCWGARRLIAESDAAAAENGVSRARCVAPRAASCSRIVSPKRRVSAPGAILLRSRPGNGQSLTQQTLHRNRPQPAPAKWIAQDTGYTIRPPSSPPLPRRLVLRATSKGLSLDPKVPMPGSTDPGI